MESEELLQISFVSQRKHIVLLWLRDKYNNTRQKRLQHVIMLFLPANWAGRMVYKASGSLA